MVAIFGERNSDLVSRIRLRVLVDLVQEIIKDRIYITRLSSFLRSKGDDQDWELLISLLGIDSISKQITEQRNEIRLNYKLFHNNTTKKHRQPFIPFKYKVIQIHLGCPSTLNMRGPTGKLILAYVAMIKKINQLSLEEGSLNRIILIHTNGIGECMYNGGDDPCPPIPPPFPPSGFIRGDTWSRSPIVPEDTRMVMLWNQIVHVSLSTRATSYPLSAIVLNGETSFHSYGLRYSTLPSTLNSKRSPPIISDYKKEFNTKPLIFKHAHPMDRLFFRINGKTGAGGNHFEALRNLANEMLDICLGENFLDCPIDEIEDWKEEGWKLFWSSWESNKIKRKQEIKERKEKLENERQREEDEREEVVGDFKCDCCGNGHGEDEEEEDNKEEQKLEFEAENDGANVSAFDLKEVNEALPIEEVITSTSISLSVATTSLPTLTTSTFDTSLTITPVEKEEERGRSLERKIRLPTSSPPSSIQSATSTQATNLDSGFAFSPYSSSSLVQAGIKGITMKDFNSVSTSTPPTPTSPSSLSYSLQSLPFFNSISSPLSSSSQSVEAISDSEEERSHSPIRKRKRRRDRYSSRAGEGSRENSPVRKGRKKFRRMEE